MTNINYNNLNLVVIKKPKEKDIDFLRNNYNLHPLVTDELTHPTFHPKIENYRDHSLLIIRFPQFNQSKKEINASEVDFIITKNELILVQYTDFEALEILIKELELEDPKRQEYFETNTSLLLYNILNYLLRSLFPQMDHIIKKVDELEEKILKKKKQEELTLEILVFRKESIDFKRIFGPNIKVIEEIAEKPDPVLGTEMSPYFSDLHSISSRLMGLIIGQAETLSVLQETNETLISNKISTIIKTLTMFSVIVFPLTLFAAIWGMNVENMPLVGHPYDFWILIAMMGAGTLVFITFFKFKKWI